MVRRGEISLVYAGGIRNGGDVAKALALGADAVAIGHSVLMALNCNKHIDGVTDYQNEIGVEAGYCYHCHTGRCPVGVTTQDPLLRKRLDPDEAAERVYNFLHTLTMEAQMMARACGKTNIHSSGAGGSGRADDGSLGDVQGAARRHQLHRRHGYAATITSTDREQIAWQVTATRARTIKSVDQFLTDRGSRRRAARRKSASTSAIATMST